MVPRGVPIGSRVRTDNTASGGPTANNCVPPQLIGTGLLIWAAVKIFPDPTIRDHIYRDYLYFLGISIVVAFVYNAIAQKSATAQFRPIPLRGVYAEVEYIEQVERAIPDDPRGDTLTKP